MRFHADAFALTIVPLLVLLALAVIFWILDALLCVGAPHISTKALGNNGALVVFAAHIFFGFTLAAARSPPDLISITVRDYALLFALRPFPFIPAVDQSAAFCFPAIVPSLVAHAPVAIH